MSEEVKQEGRADYSKVPTMITWNRLKLLRDANKKVSKEADLLMQAIEVAPELDESMQVAFGIQPIPTGTGGSSGFAAQPQRK